MTEIEALLADAQRLGFLGPGPIAALIEHSLGFAEVIEGECGGPPGDVLDLGSGGGVPGLVLGERWRSARVGLVEGSVRRSDFLSEAIDLLGWAATGHAVVVALRAEEVGRLPAWRETAEIVAVRSFGPPAVTVECAAPLLRVGGTLIVSEPPVVPETRWPREALVELGMEPGEIRRARGYGYQVLRKVAVCSARFPRRVGIPAKRPLY